MIQDVLKFSGYLALALSVIFAIHISILKAYRLPLFANNIVLAYLINSLLAIGIYILMLLSKRKYQSQLGFIFMFGSSIKFIVFFIVFYPIYKTDGNITKFEFTAFFIPYAISLVIETISLSKWLNKLG
jgi:hypothetical protein